MLKRIAKILKITALCIVVVLIVAALLYYVPHATPIDLTLNATKLDEAGNVLGTVQIHIKGQQLDYLFRESRWDVEIEPFDDLPQFQLSDSPNGRGTIHTYSSLDPDVLSVYGGCFLPEETYYLYINYTEEMDCFSIQLLHKSSKIYYVASASGNYDTQGIIDYFNNICGGLVPDRLITPT